MITSFIEGRVRIRDKALRNPEAMNTVLTMIRAQDGVLETSANPRTGSILVIYDPEKISQEMLQQAAELLQKELRTVSGAEECCVPAKKRVSPLSAWEESLLMGGLYALTAATGFTTKRAHIALGVAFAAIAGIHLYDRRRCLRR